MNRTGSIVAALCLLLAQVQPGYAQTEFEGEVSGEWNTDGSPYIQVGNATVPADESLTILPGVEVFLGEDLTLTCNGHITAQGTEDDTIYFHGPDGMVSGSFILNTGEDTIRFQYCRFDSLEDAIWMQADTYLQVRNCFFWENFFAIEGQCIWVDVTHSTFIAQRQNGKVLLGRDRRGGYYDGAVANFTDNLLQGRIEVEFHCQSALVEHNEALFLIVDDDEYNPYFTFFECRNCECSNNQNFGISTFNQNRALNSVLIENNESNSFIGLRYPGNARVIVQNNRCSSITFRNARNAEAIGNLTNGIGIHDGSRIVLTRNFGDIALSGDDNVVEVNNCTMVRVRRLIDPPIGVIHLTDGDQYHGNRVTLRNNIIFGRQNCSFAVDEGIAVEGDGYNCIWGVPTAYADREDLLPNDLIEYPNFRGGYNFDCRLRADSPCIDAGDPDSPRDPDGTGADIGCFYFDQEHGEPPALDREWDFYTGWWQIFRYTARAVDEGESVEIRFEGLPEWLQVEDDGRRDFVQDSVVVSGEVPEDQEDFVFRVIAQDDQGEEDTLSVRVMVYRYTVLTGVVRGVLDIEQSPFLITDTAWVPAGDSLVLPPGTELFFDNREDSLAGRANAKLIVEGDIRAVGTEEDSIYIGAIDPEIDNFGFKFEDNPNGESEFRYCAFKGIRCRNRLLDANYSYSHTLAHEGFNNEFVAASSNGNLDFFENHGDVRFEFIGNGSIHHNSIRSMAVWAKDSLLLSNNTRISLVVYNGIDVNIKDNSINNLGVSEFRDEGDHHAAIHDNILDGTDIRQVFSVDGVNVNFMNNIIKNGDGGIEVNEGGFQTLISNNVIHNVGLGIRQNYPDEDPDNLQIYNNVFNSIDTLVYVRYGGATGIQYNSISDFAFISNDTTFNTSLVRINANGDSCDANFNIYLDPRIASADSLDFRLYSDSPLIDAGDPDSSFNDVDSTINDIGLFGGPCGMAYEYLDPNEVLSFIEPPREFRVGNAYPNPFNATSNITVEVPYHGTVSFQLFDVQGRRIAHHNLQLTAGVHRRNLSELLNMDVSELRSGLYFLTVEFGQERINRKLVLVK
jgi:hypothetical protein